MWRFLTLGICLFFLTACGRVSVQEQQAYVFGTRVEVLVVGDDPALGRQAITSVLQEFDRLHRVYHAWQESELTALNSAIFDGRPQQADKPPPDQWKLSGGGFLRGKASETMCRKNFQ